MIIACEPICCGFEHSGVNAGVLKVLAEAFPDEGVLFCAEEGHLESVMADPLGQANGAARWETIPVPARNASKEERTEHEFATVRRMCQRAKDDHASLLLFTCGAEITIQALKTLLPEFPSVRCAMVLHGALASVLERPSLLPWKNRDTLRTRLFQGNSERLSYIVMGESIERELVRRFPALEPFVVSLDHPYHFAPPQEHLPFQDGVVRFGALGVLRKVKGSDRFLTLAKEVCAAKTATQPRFTCVGPVVDKKLRKLLDGTVHLPSPDAPLSREEFALHAQRLDYAVFLHRADAYTLTASGVLFDAISYLKPVIALRNPFFSHYFERLGDIGYLCDSYADLKRTVLRLLEDPPREAYQRQRQALMAGRELLRIPQLAETLRARLGVKKGGEQC